MTKSQSEHFATTIRENISLKLKIANQREQLRKLNKACARKGRYVKRLKIYVNEMRNAAVEQIGERDAVLINRDRAIKRLMEERTNGIPPEYVMSTTARLIS